MTGNNFFFLFLFLKYFTDLTTKNEESVKELIKRPGRINVADLDTPVIIMLFFFFVK